MSRFVVGGAFKTLECAKCRTKTLRDFISLHSVRPHARQNTRILAINRQEPVRCYSQIGRSHDGKPTPPMSGPDELESDAPQDLEDQRKAAVSTVPWYLQVENPSERQKITTNDHQELPELPQSPPPILEPLLQHISIDLGLDDLSLLDLRHLDPPPALGANLLMIIGTARSEKHLHVSADRLCRWLRSEHGLRPDADGLLGRGELKVKLRRKARRMTLLGSRAESDNYDDGISTGWVCVNVGRVDPAPHVEAVQQPANFVGFTTQSSSGVRIVVQMLVEEKRQEIDLESLWNGVSKRQLDGRPAEAGEALQLESEITGNEDEVGLTNVLQPNGNFTQDLQSKPRSNSPSQTRSFHTSTRTASSLVEDITSPSEVHPLSTSRVETSEDVKLESLINSVMELLNFGSYKSARRLLYDHRTTVPELQGNKWRQQMFSCLINHMEALPHDQAREKLGMGNEDLSSTPFLACFHSTFSRLSPPAEGKARVWLPCYARSIGHEGYTRQGLLQQFQEYQDSAAPIPRSMFIQVLRSVLRPNGLQHPTEPPPQSAFDDACNILRQMDERGQDILIEDIFLALHESIAFYPPPGTDLNDHLIEVPNMANRIFNLPTRPISAVHIRLNTVMSALGVPVSSEAARLRLFELFAAQHDWISFWELWRSFPRSSLERSAALYAKMFVLVAQTNHQRGCMTVLRSWVPEMELERVPVHLEGDVLDAVIQCLAVADPEGLGLMLEIVEGRWDPDQPVRGEWPVLWQRCAAARLAEVGGGGNEVA